MCDQALHPSRQKGTALIIVLVLVATLSFIVLSLAQQTTMAAHRGLNVGARQELVWRAHGVEALAAAIIGAAHETGNNQLTLESQFFRAVHELPVEEGTGQLWFADHTTCFNVNSLASANSEGGQSSTNEAAKEEFVSLAESLNMSSAEALSVASSIIDWIDTDSRVESGGAEDAFYTALPVPYRTGGVPLADLSEMRAMNTISKEIYNKLRPFLCALPQSDPSIININHLTPAHTPVLVGLARGKLSFVEALSIIQARPPGGFTSVEQFTSLMESKIDETVGDISGRLTLKSRFVSARSTLQLSPASLSVYMIFKVGDNGDAALISRQFGDTQ